MQPREKMKALIPTGSNRDANGNRRPIRPFKGMRKDLPKSLKQGAKIVDLKKQEKPKIQETAEQLDELL
jgi:hypothetical protein